MWDETLVLAHLADSAASPETLGLIPSCPALRPADILTTAALPGRLAALDVGVASPDAAGADGDCCDAAFRRKVREHGPHLRELEAAGVVYRPLVFSAFGRLHPESQTVLATLAGSSAGAAAGAR